MTWTNLKAEHVNLPATRTKLGTVLDLGTRKALAKQFKITAATGYQTKYWPLDMVLWTCEDCSIAPELTEAGRRLTLPPVKEKVVPILAKERSEVKQVPTPPATEVKDEPVQDEPVALTDAEREARRAKLQAFIDERIAVTRSQDDEEVKRLIASVASASAGSAVEMALGSKGQAMMAEVKRLSDEALERAIQLVNDARPIRHEIKINDLPVVKLNGHMHEAFDEVLLLAQCGENVMLVGPTGCGKTHLAEQVALAMGFDLETEFAVQSVSGGMGESKLVGGLLPTGEAGRFEPFWTDFLRLYQNGGLFLADEGDAGDENVWLVINSALSNGYLDVQGIGRIRRSKNKGKPFVMLTAMNTFGKGANRQYVGRNELDAATLDRFIMGQVEMDYDRTLEKALCTTQEEWLKACWKARDAINATQLRRNVSTRFILSGKKMLDQAPDVWSVEKGLRKLVLGWSQDEKQKAGLAHL
jgi:cobaltochelatase CobS